MSGVGCRIESMLIFFHRMDVIFGGCATVGGVKKGAIDAA